MKQLLLAVFFFGTVYAFTAQVAFALTISPVRVEVQGDPGQTLRGELEILNEQAASKQFYSSFENFEPAGDTGSPHFVGGDSGLATWMNTESYIEIRPNEKKNVSYTITIPKDAEPGGYFSAIFWGGQDPSALQAGEVSIGGKLGVLILLRVNGEIAEGAGISEFKADGPSRFHTALPITFSYRFTNSGGDRVVPLGNITIKNTFRGETQALKANALEGNVLPGSTRKFSSVWEQKGEYDADGNFFMQVAHQIRNPHFGIYTADIDIVYGATNQPASGSYTFFMIPWQLLLVTMSVLSVTVLAVRKYNAWIIARSRS